MNLVYWYCYLLVKPVFPQLFQSDSVKRPLGFQLDFQRPPLLFQVKRMFDREYLSVILLFFSQNFGDFKKKKKKSLHFDFICNFAIFLPNSL